MNPASAPRREFPDFQCARCKEKITGRQIPKTWATMMRADIPRDMIKIEFVLCAACLLITRDWLWNQRSD